jgi:hypothetical protein
MSPLTPGVRILVAALLALGTIQASPSWAEGIKLQYSSTPGDKAAYQMLIEGKTTVFVGDRTQTSSIKTEMFLTQNVGAFNNGIITLKTKIDSGTINVNGQPSPIPMIGQEVVTDMKRDGTIVANSGFQGLDLKSMQLVFPDKELNVNDSWTSDIPATDNVPVDLKVTYTVVGVEKIKDQDCVKIQSKVRSGTTTKIEGLTLNVQADGNIYFAYKAGRMMKNDVKSQMNMILKRVVNNQEQRIITKMEMDMRMEYTY